MSQTVIIAIAAAGVILLCVGIGLAVGIPSARKKQREVERLTKVAAEEDAEIAAINAAAVGMSSMQVPEPTVEQPTMQPEVPPVPEVVPQPMPQPMPQTQPVQPTTPIYPQLQQPQMQIPTSQMLVPQAPAYNPTMQYPFPQQMPYPQQYQGQQQYPTYQHYPSYPQQRQMGGYGMQQYPQNPYQQRQMGGYGGHQQYPQMGNAGWPYRR